MILNLERACQAAIDMGLHYIRLQGLGLPQNNREIFEILEQQGVIEEKLKLNLQAVVGFRNISVHDYQALSLPILKSILENNLDDLQNFPKILVQL